MHIDGSNTRNKYYMLENGETIEITEITEEKDLGITFSNNMKFSKHIVNCSNKANKIIWIIRRTFSYMEKDMFLQFYKTLIKPHLEYGSVKWSPYLKKDIYLLENVQRRATKLAKEVKDLPYQDRMKNLGLPTLQYRRDRSDMIQVYKILNDIDKLDTDLFFKKPVCSTTRGHKYKLQKSHCELAVHLAVAFDVYDGVFLCCPFSHEVSWMRS